MSPQLRKIFVDQAWYLSRYPDVEKAIAGGTVADAAEHYRRFGFFEHRMPVKVTVEEDWYLREYPDVGTAVRDRVFPSAQAHFDLVGYAEGRLPYAGFGLRDEAVGTTNGAAVPIQRPRRPGASSEFGS